MDWIFVLCFPRMKEKDIPFLIQIFTSSFTKTSHLIKKTHSMGLCICFA